MGARGRAWCEEATALCKGTHTTFKHYCRLKRLDLQGCQDTYDTLFNRRQQDFRSDAMRREDVTPML
jgi:hypothetical protein